MSHTHSKQSGEFEVHGWYGEVERGGTRQCVHCQATWVAKPGSGVLRGWCQNCNGFVCGIGCAECVHWEQKVENAEAGRPADYKPVRVWVPPGIDDLTG